MVNKTGQTALEIADFWNQTSIIHLLTGRSKEDTDEHHATNYFGFNPLDRCANKRTDIDWLNSITKDPNTKFLLFSKSSPYVTINEDGSYHMCTFNFSQVSSFIESTNSPVSVLLGVGTLPSELTSGESPKGSPEEETAWFALDVSEAVTEEEVQKINSDAQLMNLKSPLALMSLQDQEAGMVAQAR